MKSTMWVRINQGHDAWRGSTRCYRFEEPVTKEEVIADDPLTHEPYHRIVPIYTEVYTSRNGLSVNIEVEGRCKSFNLTGRGANGETPQTVGEARGGYYSDSPWLFAWLQTARDIGLPARYAHGGVANALGHYSSEAPPWKAHEKDYDRE